MKRKFGVRLVPKTKVKEKRKNRIMLRTIVLQDAKQNMLLVSRGNGGKCAINVKN